MLKKLLIGSLFTVALITFTGCTNGNDADAGKCGAGKCDSAKTVEKKCDSGKCDGAKATDAKCGSK